jgi:hypothetical protein
MIIVKANLSKDRKLRVLLVLQTEAYLYDYKLQSQTFIVQATSDFRNKPTGLQHRVFITTVKSSIE